MFAIIKTGGKQYRVKKGTEIRVEKLAIESGEVIDIKDVLCVSGEQGVKIGTPFLSNVTVKAEVINQMRDRKVIVFKKKRRHNYRRKKGHRQDLTVLRIQEILAS
jgi:large subunit ribosomal protein L21